MTQRLLTGGDADQFTLIRQLAVPLSNEEERHTAEEQHGRGHECHSGSNRHVVHTRGVAPH